MLLVDGGVLNPVPIAPTFSDNTELKIAVNLGGAVVKTLNKVEPLHKDNNESSFLHSKVRQFIDKLSKESVKALGIDWNIYDVANQSFDAMQSTIARQKLAAYPPDVVFEIPRNACGTLEFDRADEMIAMGCKEVLKWLESKGED